MCVIAALEVGQTIPDDMLMNACFNNWHSYGLVILVDGKLDIVKKVPESGEIDWKEVKDLLEDNKDHRRFLHLRHTTAGKTDMENCHPFDIYYNQKSGDHVVFMHNGTMYPFKSKKIVNGISQDDDSGPSDTKNFVDQVLIPYVTGCDFGNGHGDINHPMFTRLIDKMWPTGSNRGLLISSKYEPLFIDKWETVGPEGSKFKASNNDYFFSIKRGPEFDRREAAKKKTQDSASLKTGGKTVTVSDFRDYPTKLHGFYSLKDSIADVLHDWDVYDRSGAISLGYATRDELEKIHSVKADCVSLMEWVFTDYAQMYDEMEALAVKHDKASKMVAALKAKYENGEAA